jgi:hypothetical protein
MTKRLLKIEINPADGKFYLWGSDGQTVYLNGYHYEVAEPEYTFLRLAQEHLNANLEKVTAAK